MFTLSWEETRSDVTLRAVIREQGFSLLFRKPIADIWVHNVHLDSSNVDCFVTNIRGFINAMKTVPRNFYVVSANDPLVRGVNLKRSRPINLQYPILFSVKIGQTELSFPITAEELLGFANAAESFYSSMQKWRRNS